MIEMKPILLLACACLVLGSLPNCDPKVETVRPFELLNYENCSHYVSYDTSTISISAFEDWNPSNGWIKKSRTKNEEHFTFDSTCLYGSPGGEGIEWDIIIAGEPWGDKVKWGYKTNFCPSKNVMGGCFPVACNGDIPEEGSLKYNEISQCFRHLWKKGTNIKILTDPRENEYVLFSYTGGESPRLPGGWNIKEFLLEKDFYLIPEEGLESTSYTLAGERADFGLFSCGIGVITDSKENVYYRFKVASKKTAAPLDIILIYGGRTTYEYVSFVRDFTLSILCIVIIVVSFIFRKQLGFFSAEPPKIEYSRSYKDVVEEKKKEKKKK